MTEKENEQHTPMASAGDETSKKKESCHHTPYSFRVLCAFDGMFFETCDPTYAQAYAEQTGGSVYSWKTTEGANWLEKGVWRCDTVGLLVLPRALPDRVDMEDDAPDDEADYEDDYPVFCALIEGMLLDIGQWLERLGFPYKLPTFFRPANIRTDSRSSRRDTNRMQREADRRRARAGREDIR